MEIAGLRWKGKYADTGFAFQKLGKLAGRHIAGKAMNLYYDVEYKEGEADIESCFQVRKGTAESGKYSVRALPGGLCVSILHKGPYDQLHCAYAALFEYIQKKGYQSLTPFREIYLKGPGLIFKGNPAHYLTEIQVLVSDKKENIQ
jgi:effector-binding domain-containing protein